jgi:hypothetical protein
LHLLAILLGRGYSDKSKKRRKLEMLQFRESD